MAEDKCRRSQAEVGRFCDSFPVAIERKRAACWPKLWPMLSTAYLILTKCPRIRSRDLQNRQRDSCSPVYRASSAEQLVIDSKLAKCDSKRTGKGTCGSKRPPSGSTAARHASTI